MLLATVLTFASPLPQEPSGPVSRGRDGLRFATEDEAWSFEIRGKLQMDFARFDADRSLSRAKGEFADGAEARRTRLDLRGRAFGELGWRAGADFKRETGPEMRDLYLETDTLGPGRWRAGHFRQPYGLENRTSSATFAFFERSVANGLSPGRDAGLMLFDRWKNGTWAVGLFQETHSDAFGVNSGDARDRFLTGRWTWLPLDEDDGERLVHLGVAFSHRAPEPKTVSYGERAEAHLGNKLIAATYAADRVEQVGLEAAGTYGSTTAQAEVHRAWVAAPGNGPSPELSAASLQMSHLLTGESREYKRGDGVFGRVKPASALGEGGGLGAWELAARLSTLDLAADQRLDVWSLALNWHWSPRTKLQLGFLRGETAGDGAVDTWMFRVHMDW